MKYNKGYYSIPLSFNRKTAHFMNELIEAVKSGKVINRDLTSD